MELMNNEQAIKDKEAAKMKKYQHIKSVSNLTFIPFVVDEHGMFGSCANQIIEKSPGHLIKPPSKKPASENTGKNKSAPHTEKEL